MYFLAQLSIYSAVFMLNVFIFIITQQPKFIIAPVSNKYLLLSISLLGVVLNRIYYKKRYDKLSDKKKASIDKLPSSATNVVKNQLSLSFGVSLTIVISVILSLLKTIFPKLLFWI